MKILRASGIGHPCDRNLWYGANGHKANFDRKALRIFAVGHALEPVAITFLREEGWEVEHNEGSQQAAQEVRIPVGNLGIISGHHDAVISRGEKTLLIDVKTMNSRAFALWKKQGTLKKSPQYVDQLHVYAQGLGADSFTGLAVVGICKDNSDLAMDIFPFDPSRWKGIYERAERVFSAPLPPDPGELPAWGCRYCGHKEHCDIRKDVETYEEPGEGVASVADPEALAAMETLFEAREAAREMKDLEDLCKKTLEERLLRQGIRAALGGGYVLRFSEILSSRFDKKRFEADHPELVLEYVKESKSTRVDIKEAVV
jgi:hypothetical protein